MFVVTAKLSKRRLVAVIAAAALVVCAGVILLYGGMGAEDGVPAARTEGTKVKTNEERVAYIKSLGWEVDETPLEFMEVRVPKEFDETYEKYNELQLSQDCDLTKYKNKRIMRYAYNVTNYPTGEKDVTLSLLVYKDRVIGGDVASARADGFIHGLHKLDPAFWEMRMESDIEAAGGSLVVPNDLISQSDGTAAETAAGEAAQAAEDSAETAETDYEAFGEDAALETAAESLPGDYWE